MPVDLAPILAPQRCALLVFECQEGVIGEGSPIPGLSAAVRDGGMLETLAGLLDAARAAAVRVVYCTVEKRADGVGNPFSTPLEMRLRAADPGHTPATTPIPFEAPDEAAGDSIAIDFGSCPVLPRKRGGGRRAARRCAPFANVRRAGSARANFADLVRTDSLPSSDPDPHRRVQASNRWRRRAGIGTHSEDVP